MNEGILKDPSDLKNISEALELALLVPHVPGPVPMRYCIGFL